MYFSPQKIPKIAHFSTRDANRPRLKIARKSWVIEYRLCTAVNRFEEFVGHVVASILFKIWNEICQRGQADRLKSGRVKVDGALAPTFTSFFFLRFPLHLLHPFPLSAFSNPDRSTEKRPDLIPYSDKSSELPFFRRDKNISSAFQIEFHESE